MVLKAYIIGFIFTSICCASAHFYYMKSTPNKNFWKILPIVTFGNGLVFPLTWIVIISRYVQSSDKFSNNVFRATLAWLAMKLFPKTFSEADK